MTLHLDRLFGGYDATRVVRDASLAMEAGELVAVLGPSGSGKTTLLRMIAGLHAVDAGSVLLDGSDITRLPAHRRRIGLVPQEGALFPRLSVAANIGYGIPRLSARHAAAHPRVRELLSLVRLDDLARRLPHELSGGQRQRVALARALAPRPRMVLLDEPFNALDAALRAEVRDGIGDLLRDTGVSAMLITHDRHEAFAFADRVAVFGHGRVLQCDTPAQLYRSPRDLDVARATGETVVLDARSNGAGSASSVVGDFAIDGALVGSARIVVRPEQLRVHAVAVTTRADADAVAVTNATVERVRSLGADEVVDLRVDGLGFLRLRRRGEHGVDGGAATSSWIPGLRVVVRGTGRASVCAAPSLEAP